MSTWRTGIPNTVWDENLNKRGGHFLQTSHWAAFNVARGTHVWFAEGRGWQALVLLETNRRGNRLYCPYGPTATTPAAFDAALDALKELAVQQGVVFIRIEPITPLKAADLRHRKLKKALRDIQPGLTWIKDVTRPKEELLAEMTPTNRNLYRNTDKKDITFRASRKPADMPIFIAMMRDVERHTGITAHSDAYYQTMASTLLPRHAATLYIAEHAGKPIAAAFVFDGHTTRYYAHAGSLTEFRKLHPGPPLLAHIIFDAKKNRQQQVDFVGAAPADQPNHRWAGFTKFKQSFGGHYKSYLGTWELPIKPVAYTLYRLFYTAHKFIKNS